eukprot:11090372-Alexandrium_andersonii.AAC.1
MHERISCSKPLPGIEDYGICSVCHDARELLAFLRARGAALTQLERAALGVQIHLAAQSAARSLERA